MAYHFNDHEERTSWGRRYLPLKNNGWLEIDKGYQIYFRCVRDLGS